jgi:hypothetical protein
MKTFQSYQGGGRRNQRHDQAINDIPNTIAAAVEEQIATTKEIGRNVNAAAQGTTGIARQYFGVGSRRQKTRRREQRTHKGSAECWRNGRLAADTHTPIQSRIGQVLLCRALASGGGEMIPAEQRETG